MSFAAGFVMWQTETMHARLKRHYWNVHVSQVADRDSMPRLGMDHTESQTVAPAGASGSPTKVCGLLPGADDHLTHEPLQNVARVYVLLLCVGLSVAAVVPFFFMGQPRPGESHWYLHMPDTDDMWLHFDQMKSFYHGLAAGKIYPRWEEDTNQGFGAPTTSYYPPGIYYLTSGFYWFTGNWLRTLLGVHLLAMIASGLALYTLARRLMSRLAAAIAMAAYIDFPYHLIDQYDRGAIAELLSFVWMPLVLLFTTNLFAERTGREQLENTPGATTGVRSHSRMLLNSAGLAASYAAFLWSHPPTAYQFSLVFSLYVLALAIWRRDWRALLSVIAAVALGLGVAAAYVYPAAVEADLIRHEYLSQHWPYHESYVFAHTARTEEHRPFFNLIDHSWIISVVAIALSAALLTLQQRPKALSTTLRRQVILWTGMGAVALFFMTRYSALLGRHIPRLEIGGFSWRMLSITTLVVSLLAGACAESAIRARGLRRKSASRLLAALVVTIIIGSASFTALRVMRPQWNAEAFEPEEEHFNYAIVPRTAPENPEDLPGPDEAQPAELDAGNGTVSVVQWQPEHREVHADLSDADDLWIRTFNFPGWTATVDGKAVAIKTGEDVGDIVIELPAGTHMVTLDYLDTPPRRKGKTISLAALVLLAGTLIVGCLGQLSRRSATKTAPLKSV
jgi:hypothetical protein